MSTTRFTDIIQDSEVIANVGTTRRNLLKRAVQQKLFEYAASYDWPHYRDVGTIVTIDDYTDGTVTVTAASKTVTGASTTFTEAMVGRKIRIGTENHFFYIDAFVSTTELTLRDAYRGTGGASQTYTIFQDEYKLDANTHKLLDLRQVQDSLMMLGLSYLDMDRWFPDPDSLNDPTYFSIIGRRDDRYTTGTISVTSGTRTLTGSSTNWLSVPGLTRGTRISLDDTDEVFTVNTVVSDTSITIYETPATTDASTTYRAFLNNIIVQVRDVPDAARLLYYRKQRIPYPLVNDEDEPDLPREYHYGLVFASIIFAYKLLGNQTASQAAEQQWKEWLALQMRQVGIDSPAIDYPRESVDKYVDVIGTPYVRLPSNYGYAL